jgi:hypothetical protein
MHRHVHIQVVHPKAVVAATVDRQRAAETLGLGVDRPVHLGPEGHGQAVGGHHHAQHAQLSHRSAQFFHGFFWILQRNDGHPFEARVELEVGVVEPIVVGAGDGHRIVGADDLAVGQRSGGVEHRPLDPHVLEKLEPALRTDHWSTIPRGWCFSGARRAEVVQRRKKRELTLGNVAVWRRQE